MKSICSIYFLLLATLISCQQPKSEITNPTPLVGGGCDGCELMYLGIPKNLHHIDTIDAWLEATDKLNITGTVYQKDQKTPAPNVIIYYWQTNEKGLYAPGKGKNENTRHGKIRGWVKTNQAGEYAIFTFKPAPYPSNNESAHIHLSIKEPQKNEYYIDAIVFEGDPLLTIAEKNKLEDRGGSGILTLEKVDGLLKGKRDIFLGQNIPNYE